MDEKNTVWQLTEPTTPVSKYPYERTVHALNPYEDAIPIPPPPPHGQKKPRRYLGVFLVILLGTLLGCVCSGVLMTAGNSGVQLGG